MRRRHLFDNGYPVATATLLAGSEVLLAIARQSLRLSSARLARSFLLLANSSERVTNSLARYGCSHAELAESRENHAHTARERRHASASQPSETHTGLESRDRPARAQPHHR